jgi:hypothetical protein
MEAETRSANSFFVFFIVVSLYLSVSFVEAGLTS